MRITLDTNIIYQGLRSNEGASHQILKMVRNDELEIALSLPVFLEYRDVLLREKSLKDLNMSKNDINSVLSFLSYKARPTAVRFLMRPNLKDESDNIFIELAFSSNSRYLITSNTVDFKYGNDLLFDSFEIVTPAEFLKKWRMNHG